MINKTMDRQEILEKLLTIITSINDSAEVNEKTALLGNSVLDSLEFMNYLTKVEESFNIEISNSDVTLKNLGIIENMVMYINLKTI